MSRTYRRKNYEKLHVGYGWSFGRKVAGAYTVEDYIDGMWIPRQPDKEERKRKFLQYHGESSHSNERSPGHYYRNRRQRENRRINKFEIEKFFKFEDYECMCENNPRPCHWDWR